MKRSLMTDLLAWKEKKDRKPLLLQGARQVGKTTLLRQFGKEHFKKVHIVNFEKDPILFKIFEGSLNPLHILTELEFHLDHTIDIEQDLLVFDEIQVCPRAVTSLKYFAEELPQLALASAGSLLGVYLGPVSFPVGKVDILTLYPMCFSEFLLALDDLRSLELLNSINNQSIIPEIAHAHLFEQLKHYFVVGGLPEVVQTYLNERHSLLKAFQAVRKRQIALIDTYLADIAKHSGKINAMHISRVWQAVPSQLAQSQDGSASKFKFKDVIPGINRFSRLAGAIDWLEAAKLIIKVPTVNSGNLPFSAHTAENNFKLYLFDVGILGAMSNLNPHTILTYEYGSYKGYFAENFIAQAFIASGQRTLYSWQEKLAEVEFLDESNSLPIPIEVKSGWVTHSKSAKIFAEKYKSPYRIIFSAKNLQCSPSVWYYPLYFAEWVHLATKTEK